MPKLLESSEASMPKGRERELIYIREQDAEGHVVVRAVQAGSSRMDEPDPPPGAHP